MSVGLTSSMPSPAPVGQIVTWTAGVSGADSGTLWYRFRTRAPGKQFRVVKDYGPTTTLDWTAIQQEGFHEIEVTVRNLQTGETAAASDSFELQPIVTGDQPVITPTSHPLVFLYSAPPCATGSRMRVHFRNAAGFLQHTPSRACQPDSGMNFYLAGFQPQTAYTVRHSIDSGSAAQYGPPLTLTTPDAGTGLASRNVVQPRTGSIQDGVLLQAAINSSSLATDLGGNVLWYYPGNVSYITRPEPGGYFFAIVQNPKGDPSQQLVREFDLVGMTVLETNAARVSEQLVAMGKRPITSFHHEARRLSDGHILVLASVEQVLAGVQGPDPVDILGDMIVVLDANLQVVWAWDTFDHLDVTRQAILGETCPGGCPPLYLAAKANDWVHGNSVQETPDGNLLYSARHQDWVIKIDYQKGAGTGNVIWRLGQDGDFRIESTDPSPWFSHQHDPQFLADGSTLILFDNGNGRNLADPSANSRGQALQVDEPNHVATLLVNLDLGCYSFALGAAQRLPNGNFHFLCGWLPDSTSMAMEVDPSGQTVFALHSQAAEYRSFRMRDLYTP